MQNHNLNKKNGTITTQVVCAVLFCFFSFFWLYWFQADIITVAQHILSGGVTHYDRTIGAVLITLVLLILQQIVLVMVKLYRRTHALTYLPSMLVLAVISDISPEVNQHSSLGAWYFGVPLILLFWGGCVWLCKKILPFDSSKEAVGFFSQRSWINMLLMVVMMLCVVSIGNTNAVFHYRAHAEVALAGGDVDEALRVGERSLETDEHLTMLRIYALARKNQLGERLFQYPIAGSGNDILPLTGSNSKLLLLPADSLWRFLGARPAKTMGVARYLQALERDSFATAAVSDYALCRHLIDRDIDAFVGQLIQYHTVSDSAVMESLPRHYREALTLYTHLRSNPVVVYHNAVMDEDWDNLQELEREYPQLNVRKGKVADGYSESYWYYYFYE